VNRSGKRPAHHFGGFFRQACTQGVPALPDRHVHIDIAEVRTAQGKLYGFVAIDRTSKLAFVRLEDSATVQTATAFLEALISAVSYRIHTVLTPWRTSSLRDRLTNCGRPRQPSDALFLQG
jgi:transposase-like protein